MADIIITDQPLHLTVSGTVNSAGEVDADLRPSTIASEAGALLAANNLSDLANASTALTNLGATSVGSSVLTAATTTAAQTALGATSTGRTLFTSASVADARSAIVANILPIGLYFTDISAATAQVRYYSFGILSGFLTDILVIIDGALVTGDLVLSVDVDSGAGWVNYNASFASLTVPQVGSAAGTLGWFPATSGINLGSASRIRITIGGANTASIGATIVVKANY